MIRAWPGEQILGFAAAAIFSAAAVLGAIFMPGLTIALAVTVGLIWSVAAVATAWPIWQSAVLVALGGYVVLNYGFTNLMLPFVGVIPVGHLLVLVGVIALLLTRGRDLRTLLKEPLLYFVAAMLIETLIHVALEFPRFGADAVRDSSVIFEMMVACVIGFAWAQRIDDRERFVRALAVLLLLNFGYSLTYPVSHWLADHSPVSGVFRPVALLGSYAHTAMYLIAGALFLLLLGGRTLGWSGMTLWALALPQLIWSLVFQMRSMYIGIILILLCFMFLRRVQLGAKIALGFLSVGAFAILVMSVFNFQFEGRMGPVKPAFLIEHLESLSGDPDMPAAGSAQWRVNAIKQAIKRWTVSYATTLVGIGFGQPLVDPFGSRDRPIRDPHNVHVALLARLGVVGAMLWAAIHLRIVALMVRALRFAKSVDSRNLALWFICFYLLSLLLMSTQPWLHYAHGAVPFFTIIGFAVGVARTAYLSSPLGARSLVEVPMGRGALVAGAVATSRIGG